ncbi:MAG: RnfABCDGE type electron transport complex subunit A [Methanocellales archaeon]|nr:RnfABCDGE type electron transport complex subunit A [Methanocellales archaeon]
MENILAIMLSAIFINNLVLTKFLGLCPLFGVSKDTKSAMGMSLAVIFVMTLASASTWLIYTYMLTPLNIRFLQTISFILLIATLVQLIELIIRKHSPPLYRSLGIYLPLITTNCAIMGAVLLSIRGGYSFVEGIVFGISAGVGFGMVLLIMSGIRERLELSDTPKSLEGVPLAFITVGILSIIFVSFFGRIPL